MAVDACENSEQQQQQQKEEEEGEVEEEDGKQIHLDESTSPGPRRHIAAEPRQLATKI